MRISPSTGLRLVLLVVFAMLLTSCSSTGSGAANRNFRNPVYGHNFPDPYILRVGKTYYAYGTGTCDRDLQVLHSTDLVNWSGPSDPLPAVP